MRLYLLLILRILRALILPVIWGAADCASVPVLRRRRSRVLSSVLSSFPLSFPLSASLRRWGSPVGFSSVLSALSGALSSATFSSITFSLLGAVGLHVPELALASLRAASLIKEVSCLVCWDNAEPNFMHGEGQNH